MCKQYVQNEKNKHQYSQMCLLFFYHMVHMASMWSHIRLQSREAPLNMIPTLSYKPTPTSMSPLNYLSTRSVISAPTSVFLQKTQGTLWAGGSRWSIEVSRRGFSPPPGGDFGSTRNPACFVWETAWQTLLTVTDMQPLTVLCVLFLLLHICSGSADSQR